MDGTRSWENRKNGITLPSWMPYHLRNTKESTFSFVLTAHTQLDVPVASSEVASGLQRRGGGAFDSLLFRVSWEKAGDSRSAKQINSNNRRRLERLFSSF